MRSRFVNRLLDRAQLRRAPTRPRQIHLAVTDRCFLPCLHCDIWKNEAEDLPGEIWRDLLDRLAQGLDLPQVRAVAGYSSWGPGQLESEISRGDWLPGPPSPKLVFRRERSKLWLAAYAEVGTSPFAFSTKKIGRA